MMSAMGGSSMTAITTAWLPSFRRWKMMPLSEGAAYAGDGGDAHCQTF